MVVWLKQAKIDVWKHPQNHIFILQSLFWWETVSPPGKYLWQGLFKTPRHSFFSHPLFSLFQNLDWRLSPGERRKGADTVLCVAMLVCPNLKAIPFKLDFLTFSYVKLPTSGGCHLNPKTMTRLSQRLSFHPHWMPFAFSSLPTISMSDEWGTLSALGVTFIFVRLPSKTVVILTKT